MKKTKLPSLHLRHGYTAAGDDGVPVVYQEGTRLEASDPAVKRHPQWWAADNDGEEIARKKRAAWAEV
jgi:hypothetical protein